MEIDIRHIAKLSRLKIEENEVKKFEQEMQDTGAALIDPDHPMKLRPDEVHHEYRREDILKNAPQVQAGCVVVPKVVE